MHIPDGVLSPEVCAVTGAISLGAVGYSLHKLKDSLADRTVPLTGMMAALVFAGQMVNFPLIGTPVSGHLMGGVLAAAVVGPWAGCLAITLVLIVQCALFADGGLLALGANVLHMAVIGSMGGYAVYAAIRRLLGDGHRGTVAGVVIASWLSVMAAALLFCIEFRLSWHAEDYNFANIFTLMVTVHSAIGVGEALITGTAIGFVLSQRPDLLYRPTTEGSMIAGLGRTMAAGTIGAMAVAAFLAPWASEFPDGLEAVAEQTQFADLETTRALLLDDYSIPLPVAGWQGMSVALAGLLGTAAVLSLALVLGRLLKFRPQVSEAGRIE